MSNITYTQDSTVKESYDYTYDSRGYITTESILNNYFSAAKDADFAYTYDTIGRLTSSAYTDNVASTTNTTSYTYDNVGNRLSKSNSQYTYSYTIGAYNQVSAITKTLTGSSTTVEASNFTYNTNGDTTGETTTTYSTETQNDTTFDVRTTLTKAYSYDYTDMMSAATVNQSVDAKISGTSDPYTNSASDSASDTYVYNGDGQRVKKITDSAVTTKYYYTGSVVLYTADADNNKISGNIATPDGQIIASRDSSLGGDGALYYFYHYDIRGSVTTLLKPDATMEQGYSYDEYGNATVENSASLFHNEMSYTGAISDATTGLSYMNARYYNPATGTFTSQDTYYGSAYSPWTQHLYSYTGGNPVNYVDPTGHRYAEFATMEGEKTKVDPIMSFSAASYKNYKDAQKQPNRKSYSQTNTVQGYLPCFFFDGIFGEFTIDNMYDSNPYKTEKKYDIGIYNSFTSEGLEYNKLKLGLPSLSIGVGHDRILNGTIVSSTYLINYGNGGFSATIGDSYSYSDGRYSEQSIELSISVKKGISFNVYQADGILSGESIVGTYTLSRFSISRTGGAAIASGIMNNLPNWLQNLKNSNPEPMLQPGL